MTDDSATLRDLEERLSQEPDNLALRIRVAELFRQAGRIADATELLRSVALAYRDQGRYDRAVAIGQSILDFAPEDTDARALVTEFSGRDDEATAPGQDVRGKEETTLVDARMPVVRPISRSRSASLAALIARPRISSRPPPLRAQVGLLRPRGGPILPPTIVNEDTPLPGALPYHIADPSTPASKSPYGLRGVRSEHTDPLKVTGLAEAARRISGLIAFNGENDDPLLYAGSDREASQMRSPAVPISEMPSARLSQRTARETEDELTSPRAQRVIEPVANAFFEALSESDREVALRRFDRRTVPAGTIVIRRGASSHPLIAVIQGRLELRFERPSYPDTVLDTIETGSYLGEAVLLGRNPAPANVVAAVDSDLLMLPPTALFELAGAYPALWAALKDSAERRTRRYDVIIRALS